MHRFIIFDSEVRQQTWAQSIPENFKKVVAIYKSA